MSCMTLCRTFHIAFKQGRGQHLLFLIVLVLVPFNVLVLDTASFIMEPCIFLPSAHSSCLFLTFRQTTFSRYLRWLKNRKNDQLVIADLKWNGFLVALSEVTDSIHIGISLLRPCSHITFFAPFFSLLYNGLHAFLWRCSHMMLQNL